MVGNLCFCIKCDVYINCKGTHYFLFDQIYFAVALLDMSLIVLFNVIQDREGLLQRGRADEGKAVGLEIV